MKKIIAILIAILFTLNLFSQKEENQLKLLVSSRVDTSKNVTKEVLRLYENYINSRPDSIYDNPYWNKIEKEMYKDFDFSRSSIFQGGIKPGQIFNAYPPFVMSVEPLGNKYQIRILFASSTTQPEYVGSKVWCIQKLNVIKEDTNWVLENLIVDLTNQWNNKTLGFVNYVYPPNFEFNEKNARKSEDFCDDIIKRFNPTYNKQFQFYITSSIDDMGLLENFDYYFVGASSGKAGKNKILSAKGNEFYPHEFIHILLPKNSNRNFIIEEGLAEFLGSKVDGDTYDESMKKLALDIEENKKINFKSVASQRIRFNGYQTAYPTGAAICELIYSKKADEGLLKLMLADTSDYGKLLSSLSEITNLNEENIIKEWKKILKTYNR